MSENTSRLRSFSIGFFSIVLGLSGMALVVVKLADVYPALRAVGLALTAVALASFAVVVAVYAARLIRYPGEVRQEILHPVKMNFFPLVAKILLVQSVIFLSVHRPTSLVFWVIGVVIQTVLMYVIIGFWIRHTKFEVHHMNPAWFMPVVGALIVPIAGVEHGAREISWFFFAVGLVLWIVLFTIVLYRLIFHPPLAGRLAPTLFILFAPPAIGFISYYKLTGALDPFARLLFYFALFMAILVFLQVRIRRGMPFFLSWWAYSFPLAALTVSVILMYKVSGRPFFRVVFLGLGAFLAVIVILLTARTLSEIRHKTLCVEEKE
jgi:tellurite resistance protein